MALWVALWRACSAGKWQVFLADIYSDPPPVFSGGAGLFLAPSHIPPLLGLSTTAEHEKKLFCGKFKEPQICKKDCPA